MIQLIKILLYTVCFSFTILLGISQLQAAEVAKGNSATKANMNAQEAANTQATPLEKRLKVGEFVWTELATNDVEKARDFYTKTFGWKFIEDKIDGMDYVMIQTNGDSFGGIWAIPQDKQDQIKPHWLSFILVENVDQTLDKATKNGATVIKPATQVADKGRFAIFKDPTGAVTAIWQPQKRSQ